MDNIAGVLMCPPVYYRVIDRKNPFMDPSIAVDRARALEQWAKVREAFERSGLRVETVEPLEDCEDMVFTANPAFCGRDARGSRTAVASRMRYPTRMREVAPNLTRLRDLGYEIQTLPDGIGFEGGGDAVWHLGFQRIFVGHGPRSVEAVDSHLERLFGAEVVPLRLSTERFYHLDTALAVIDADTAIVHPQAFDGPSYDELARHFTNCIEIDEDQANRMAANASRAGGNTVLIDRGAGVTAGRLAALGYDVCVLDTSEFMKSGGSVYCMKQYLF